MRDNGEPRNVVGNRFLLRVSEELKAMSLNLRGMSVRFSRGPSSRERPTRQLHTSNLSHLSSIAAGGVMADYHQSPQGMKMQQSANPGFDKRAYSHKGAMVKHILNEVQPGMDQRTSVSPTVAGWPANESDPEIEKTHRQRVQRFRAIMVLASIIIIAIIAGVASASPANSRQSNNLGNAGTSPPQAPTIAPFAFDLERTEAPSIIPSDLTFSPTILTPQLPTPQPTTGFPSRAPTNSPTQQPTTAFPTRSPTRSPTVNDGCVLIIFCLRRRLRNNM